ncbi:hypothetical protein L195_g045745, partial [Trifolium pratense]
MKVDSDPLQVAEISFVEPFECTMVEAMEATTMQVVSEEEYAEKIKGVYPQAEEELVDFLNKCKLSNKEVMLCPRCSIVCDKEAIAGLTNYVPYVKNKGNWPRQSLNKRKENFQDPTIQQRLGPKTFVPANRVPVNQWANGRYAAFNKKILEKGASSQGTQQNVAEAKKYSYRNNYMARGKLATIEEAGGNVVVVKPVETCNLVVKKPEMVKRPIKERISLLPSVAPVANEEEDEYMDDDLLDEDQDFNVLVNVVSILPREYDMWSMSEEEDLEDILPVPNIKPICYYVMDNGCVEQQQAIFEKSDEGMKNHMKPLFVRAKVNDVSINKVLIDGGAAVNLMPLSLLSKIGKYETNLHSH